MGRYIQLKSEDSLFKKAGVWNVDTGAAFKGPLTILDVDTKGILAERSRYQAYIR